MAWTDIIDGFQVQREGNWPSGSYSLPPDAFVGGDNKYYARNPKTGQVEPIAAESADNGQPIRYHYGSEAPPQSSWHLGGPVTPGDFMYKFTKVGVPIGLAIMGGAAAASAMGAGAAGAAGAGAAEGGAAGASGTAGLGAAEAAGAMGGAAGTAGGGLTTAEAVGVTGAAGAGAGGTTAGTTTGVSAGAGGEFTGGLTGTATGSPGLSAGSFNAAGLGAGGTATAPGLVTPAAGVTGAGALSAGSFAAESLYPAIGGSAAAAGATGLGTPSAGSNALTTGAATGAGGTALSRLLDGSASTADYLSLLGTAGATGLGIYGANQQTKSLEELAGQYMAMGAPSRGRYESSFMPGFSMATEPGYKDSLDQTTKSFLHKASIGGNPADSPNAWKQTLSDVNSTFTYPALQNYRSMNANAGGLSRFAEAAPGAATGAIGAQRGVYDAVGYGAANLFNPPSTLEQLMRSYRQ